MFSAVDMAVNGSANEKRAWLKARSVRLKAGRARVRAGPEGDTPFDGQLDGL